MTVSITYNIAQSINADGGFTVVFEVLDAVEIQREIFVFDSGDAVPPRFTGVATLYDMRTWPAVRDTDLMSYRALSVTHVTSTLDAATSFAAYTQGRIESLRATYQQYLDEYVESRTVITPEP